MQTLVVKIATILGNRVAPVVLSVLVLVIIADVVLRYFFGRGIPGSYELTEFMFGLIVFFGLGYTQVKRRHINVDFLVSRFPKKVQLVVNFIKHLVVLLLLALICWQTILRAVTSWQRDEVSGVLHIPIGPFVFAAGAGILVFLLTILPDLFHTLKGKN
jgi:TRAP-type C4-dicarboxylate transport system permease small subunit